MRLANGLLRQLSETIQPALVEAFDSESEKNKVLGNLRWCVIIAQIAVILPAIHWEFLLKDNLPLYLCIVGVLALFNLIAKRLTLSVLLQLSIDLWALCALLILTAGCHNPFSSLLFVCSIMGPMFLTRSRSIIYLLEAAIGLALVCSFTEPVLINAKGHEVSALLTLSVKITVLFVLGSLSLWLKFCLESFQQQSQLLFKQRQRLNNFRAIGVVAGQLSHELSTPLNTIKIMLSRFARKTTNPHNQLELSICHTALTQCEQTVKNLFETSVNADSLAFKEMRLAEFIRSICEKWQIDFPGVLFRFEIDELVESVSYKLPTTPFAQAVLDVLDNAKEATEHKESEIRVDMKIVQEAVNISISDRGKGLDPKIQKHIGEPFTSSKTMGTGLGLYNAITLIEALGGTFGIGPRKGGGTTVSLVLPL